MVAYQREDHFLSNEEEFGAGENGWLKSGRG